MTKDCPSTRLYRVFVRISNLSGMAHEDLITLAVCVDNIKTAEKRDVNRFISSRLYAGKVVYFLWNMIILLKRGWNVKTELHLPGAWKFHSERNK
jgi:hypothetical protein